MKTKLSVLILAMCLTLLSGCGLLGNKGVPKEQINSDLAGKTIKVRSPLGESSWDFKDDYIRCFALTPNETKTTESNVDTVIDVSSMKYPTWTGVSEVMFGKILLRYKKDGDKWTLESIEPKDASTNNLEGEKAVEFAKLSAPLCNYFKHSTRDEKK
jgi:predicted small lipoprotein YifL